MTTRAEIHDQLHERFDGKPFDEFRTFIDTFSLEAVSNTGWTTDPQRIAGNIEYLCDKADKYPEKYVIPLCRALDLLTPDEAVAMNTKKSVAAAETSAKAASAANAIAKGASLRSWLAIAIASLGLFVSGFQCFRG